MTGFQFIFDYSGSLQLHIFCIYIIFSHALGVSLCSVSLLDLRNYWLTFHEFHGPRRINSIDLYDPLTFSRVPPLDHVGFLVEFLNKYSMDCHETWYNVGFVPRGWIPVTLATLRTFNPALPAGQRFQLFNKISQHQLDWLAKKCEYSQKIHPDTTWSPISLSSLPIVCFLCGFEWNYWRNYHEIWYRHPCPPWYEWQYFQSSPDFSVSSKTRSNFQFVQYLEHSRHSHLPQLRFGKHYVFNISVLELSLCVR